MIKPIAQPYSHYKNNNELSNSAHHLTSFEDLTEQVLSILNNDIEILLERTQMPSPLSEACAYAMRGNGKRVRPLLVATSYHTVMSTNLETKSNSNTDISTNPNSFLNSACRRAMLAVELLHTYSLIHDDLPCMDDDDLRRGRPTCHIEFDEATALLAGDVLQTLAFEVLSPNIEGFEPISEISSTELLRVFAPRARRMVMGQMLDLNAENKTVNQTELENIHRDKTGALIEAATLMGGVCAFTENDALNIDTERTKVQSLALHEFATSIGLAFQVQDDILDVIGNTQELGKPAGSDEGLNKSTYVKLMGVKDAKEYAKTLFDSSHKTVSESFGNNTQLHRLADWLWSRQK